MNKNTLFGVMVAVMLLGAGVTVGRMYSVATKEPVRVLAEKTDKPENEKCVSIKDGGLKTMDSEDVIVGFNDQGYNYQAKIFKGKFCDVYSGDGDCDEDNDTD